MAKVLTGISGNLISAASAGFAPTNSADVSAIASAYQVVSATATQLYAGTAYVTSVNGDQLSAARAGNAANASLANSAWYDGTGRLISALPDSAAVSAIASSYAESAASSKQDTLTFGYDTSDKISSINGSSLAGEGGGLITATGSALNPWYLTSVSSINGFTLSAQFADSADKAVSAGNAYSALYAYSSTNAHEADTVKSSALSAYMTAVSSPSGTVRISVGTAIDCTDSAVVGEYIAGSSGILTGSEAYIKPLSNVQLNIYSGLPTLEYNTQLMLEYGEACTIYFSGDNGESADISYAGLPTSINVPIHSASAIAAYTDNSWITNARLYFTADSVDNSHLVPLAHASALPTYQYNTANQISSIDGSALGGMDEAAVSGIASAYAESAVSAASGNYYTTANESGFLTAQAQASWSESASASPSYIVDKPDLVDIVAGPGIVVDNPDGNTLRVSQTYPTDETVLFEDTGTTGTVVSSVILSEAASHFSTVEITLGWAGGGSTPTAGRLIFRCNPDGKYYGFGGFIGTDASSHFVLGGISANGTTLGLKNVIDMYSSNLSGVTFQSFNAVLKVFKVVGINRTASN